MGLTGSAFRGSTGAESKVLEAGTYVLCWSGILGGWVSERELGEKSSRITGSEGGGWWEQAHGPSSLLPHSLQPTTQEPRSRYGGQDGQSPG